MGGDLEGWESYSFAIGCVQVGAAMIAGCAVLALNCSTDWFMGSFLGAVFSLGWRMNAQDDARSLYRRREQELLTGVPDPSAWPEC